MSWNVLRLDEPEGHSLPAHRVLRLDELEGNALPLAIGHRLFLAVEMQRELLLHVARRGPAHQGFDRARLLGLVLEPPFLGGGPARLHCVLGGLENASVHGWSAPWKNCGILARVCMLDRTANTRTLIGDSRSGWYGLDRYSHYAAP